MRIKMIVLKRKYEILYKLLFAQLFIFTLPQIPTQAQRIHSVVFNQLPQDYQLYPRNTNNEAVVPVSGVIEVAGYKHISVQVLRNNEPQKYLRAEIKYNAQNIGSFSTLSTIKAELAEYSFVVYACTSGDSILIAERKNVVSGDTYLLTGQSNSTGFFTEEGTHEYCRSFGKITGNLNTGDYNPADTLWALSNQKNSGAMVGAMGLEIQKQLVEKSGVPNCLINGGFHWSSAYSHAIRNANNPSDLTNGYGRMIYRVQKAGLTNGVRAVIFRQGETEAYNEGWDWAENFDKMRTNLHKDLPNLEKLYVFQIDVIYYPSSVGAMVRETQRQLPNIYPDVKSIATVGTADFDGLHYGTEGNRQNGMELSRLIARDLYGSSDTDNIDSPSIKRIFYRDNEKKQLILSFDDGQELIYPEKHQPNWSNTPIEMKDHFYLDGIAGAVTSGSVNGNKIILELNGSQTASTLNYLPDYFIESIPGRKYTGPYITNKLGMRAFSFYQVPIGVALDAPVLSLKVNSGQKVEVNWTEIPGAEKYVIERKEKNDGNFQYVTTVSAPSKTLLDDPMLVSRDLTYRIQAIAKNSESLEFGSADVTINPFLGVNEPNLNTLFAYPNPAIQTDKYVKVKFGHAVTGVLSLVNILGKTILSQNLHQIEETDINLTDTTPGIHFIRFDSKGTVTYKLIIK